MNFKEFIDSFSTGDSSWQESPVLSKRINMAKNVINGIYDNKRTIQTPEYLTDFGLRKTDSPRLFIEASCEKLNKRLPTDSELKEELLSLDINNLGDWIDMVVLVLGKYDICYEVLKARIDNISSLSIANLIKMATLCGIENDPQRAIKLFEIALKKCKDTETREVISHRINVTLLKRQKNIDMFFTQTNNMVTDIMYNPTFSKMVALLDNLVGLQLVLPNQKDHSRKLILARLLLANAKLLLNEALSNYNHVDEHLPELVRYYSQIAINQVQIELELNNLNLAESIILKDIELVKKYNSEYLSEALSSLAYVYYAERNFQSAVNTVIKAIHEHIKIGNIVGINESKKLLIVAMYKLGKQDCAQKLLNSMTSDPTGMSENYDQYYI